MTRNAVRSSCVSGRCFAGMFALLSVVARAQLAAVPVPVEGSPAAELAARAVRGGGVALLVTAHPDDEDNASAALLRHRHGVRVVLWTMTRGEGGQNEIGSEQGEALNLLRDFIELQCGIALTEDKAYLVETRLAGMSESVARLARSPN